MHELSRFEGEDARAVVQLARQQPAITHCREKTEQRFSWSTCCILFFVRDKRREARADRGEQCSEKKKKTVAERALLLSYAREDTPRVRSRIAARDTSNRGRPRSPPCLTSPFLPFSAPTNEARIPSPDTGPPSTPTSNTPSLRPQPLGTTEAKRLGGGFPHTHTEREKKKQCLSKGNKSFV